MKKLILLFIFLVLTLNLFAKHVEAKYDITYGNFLDLGIATTTLEINKNSYKIKIKAKTTGMAKYLTNNREEIYESYGKFVNNQFIPNKFIKTKKDDYKKRVRIYTFNHKEKKILVNDKKTGIEKKMNSSFKKVLINIDEEKNSELDYFAKDDILSLFFNINQKLVKYENGKEYTLNAVGANKTKGIINILMPTTEKLKQMNEVLKTDDKSKFTAFINQKIFQSKRGELLISLDHNGFCSYAVLKDVLFFGDIVGKMVKFKTDEG
ncbi:DUF3108 domain-containing protein [Arcobacter sp. LA11]|uniref:DUF3108 domain-containing protein n=1 Tax=Arcobacter sp. LA11 TaxID=1898176 RepID=UPI000934D6B2|nr:DUF3108 domain-containing protein [Arcobacter sp. LA11]